MQLLLGARSLGAGVVQERGGLPSAEGWCQRRVYCARARPRPAATSAYAAAAIVVVVVVGGGGGGSGSDSGGGVVTAASVSVRWNELGRRHEPNW